MNPLLREVRLFWTALTLLTRLPAPRLNAFEPDWLPRSVPWFPVVGLLVGLLAGGLYVLTAFFWRDPVPAVLALSVAALVTGGFHEDGWADVFDALGAGGDRTRMLEVMKDSRIGATGALALILLVAGKLAGLFALPAADVPAALVAAHVLSRWATLPLLRWLPAARAEGGLATPLIGHVTSGRFLAGTLTALLLAVAALRQEALSAILVTVLVTALSGLFFRRRLGGVTGDCLGATQQLVELAVLLTLAAGLPFLS
jgi:adenosylcobinamide-GDP ribazoletransferase